MPFGKKRHNISIAVVQNSASRQLTAGEANAEIADWLEKLGLEQYALRFAENGIDLGVLPELTDQDFDRLGVLLGHRRKMLRSIAELNQARIGSASRFIGVMPSDATSPSCSAIW